MSNHNHTYNGKIILILGCMFSSKTTELLRQLNRYKIAGKKCMLIKYKNDTRYDATMVTTHDNIKNEAYVSELLEQCDSVINNYDVICIDEIQFYKDADIYCDKWANSNKIVICCGLNGTFNREPFPIISKLIPLVEEIIFLKAICRNTGEDAVFSKLNNKTSNEIEQIGGSEMYSAVDRITYFQN